MQILDTIAQLVIAAKLRRLDALRYFGSWYGRTDVGGLNGAERGRRKFKAVREIEIEQADVLSNRWIQGGVGSFSCC
jgi:hypothetical protein